MQNKAERALGLLDYMGLEWAEIFWISGINTSPMAFIIYLFCVGLSYIIITIFSVLEESSHLAVVKYFH